MSLRQKIGDRKLFQWGWSTRKRALHSAYQIWARCYPQWADAYFDLYFLEHGAKEVLLAWTQDNQRETAEKLAEAWTHQFPLRESYRRGVLAELVPAVQDFLYLFATEECYELERRQENQLQRQRFWRRLTLRRSLQTAHRTNS